MEGHGATLPQDYLDAPVRIPEQIVFRHFAAETVILNLTTGKYHGLNPTGGTMMETLQKLGTIRASIPELARTFGQPEKRIEQDLVGLCRDLIDRNLLAFEAREPS
jgi:hypothetical protein